MKKIKNKHFKKWCFNIIILMNYNNNNKIIKNKMLNKYNNKL